MRLDAEKQDHIAKLYALAVAKGEKLDPKSLPYQEVICFSVKRFFRVSAERKNSKIGQDSIKLETKVLRTTSFFSIGLLELYFEQLTAVKIRR